MHPSERMYACVSGMTDALSVERWRHWVIKNDGWKRHTALSSPSLFAHLTDCHSSEPNTHRCRGLDFMLLSSPRQGHIAVAPLPIISVCSDNSSIHNFTQISFLRHLSPKNTHTNMRLKHMHTQGRKTLRHKLSLMSISFMTNSLKSISRILC